MNENFVSDFISIFDVWIYVIVGFVCICNWKECIVVDG